MGESKTRFSIVVLVVAGVLALFLWLGLRERGHCDEFAYLYGAAHFATSTLARGEFESSNVVGFFNVKLGHIMLLRLLVNWFGTGMCAIQSIQAVYTAMVAATSGMLVLCIWLLWGDLRRALAMGVLSLLTPVNVYLAPRLLAEVPGMFGAMASMLFLALALRTQHRMKLLVFLSVSALALAYGILARQNAVLSVAGGWVALWVACPSGLRRKEIFRAVVVVGLLALGALLVSQVLLHLDPLRGIQAARTVMAQYMPRREIVSRAALAFGPLLLGVPLALVSQRKRELVFYSIWFAWGVLPILLGFHYLDLRSVVTGAPALAGLALLGAEVLWRWIGSPRHVLARLAGIGLGLMILVRSNVYIQPRIQYEVDTSAYSAVMRWINSEYPHRPVLIPWGQSDYHFLRVAYPQSPVYLANTTIFEFTPLNYATDVSHWTAALQNWYGDRYIGDLVALERLGSPPWLYVTWQIPGWDTGRFSWVRDDPRLRLTLMFQHARYRVYRIDKR